MKVENIEETMDNEDPEENNVGLAFSGGGIRSAAFSSGILRRLLQKNIQVDYISCISGGNLTAGSYMDWKYRNGKKDEHKWHHDLFEHMRSRTGYLCDWTNCCSGLIDTLMMFITSLFVNLLIPVIIWGGLAFPSAYLMDYLFGPILRTGFNCTVVIPAHSRFAETTGCSAVYDHHYPGVENQLILFVVLMVSFFVMLGLKVVTKSCLPLSRTFHFLMLVSGGSFAGVFLPWLLQQVYDVIPLWLTILILVLSLFFWIGFPPLRKVASFAVVVYLFAFVIKWRVYRSRCIFLDYKEQYFYTALLASGAALWASPYLGTLTQTAAFRYATWKIQRSFFHKASTQSVGCCTCCSKNKPLTMADLADMKPQYISNIVAAYWRREPEARPDTFLGVGSKKIEIITEQPGSDNLNCVFSPKHITLSNAMSTGVMVVKPEPNIEDDYEPIRELQLILGMSLANLVNSSPSDGYRVRQRVVAFAVQSIIGAPIILLAVLWLGKIHMDPLLVEMVVMIVFAVYLVLFGVIAMMPTGAKKAWFGENLVRWCQVYLYHVRFLRDLFNIYNNGPVPPAVMSLSDLGRLEKYGLLVLFKRRFKKIVIADGSFITNNDDYAKQLLQSLEIARECYYCEFTGFDNRDVIGEIRKMYLKHPSGKLPRSYRFLVHYYDKTSTGYQKTGQGEVMILAPRHPKTGFDFPSGHDFTWKEYKTDTGIQMDPTHWGSGPVLKSDEVDSLTWCCCECCHSSLGCCQSLSRKACFAFPSHSTGNQFFTPRMFSAYHREGYRASVEGDVEGFLKNKNA